MESIVSTLVTTLVTNIAQLLVNEANLLSGVKDQVQSLEKRLPYMTNFIKDSEGKRENHPDLIQLVDDIRNVACEAEDIVDTYVFNVAKQRRKNIMVKFFRGGFDQAAMLHGVSTKITKLQTTIDEIYANEEKFKIKRSAGGANEAEQMRERVQKQRKEVEEENVVGFVDETQKLVNLLVKRTDENLQKDWTEELDVISIFGMGGLGKTTLARKVYKDLFVRDNFRCRAWVSVSQDFKLRDLLLEIIDQVAVMTDEIAQMREQKLKDELKKHLSNHRYLVVLDDIWSSRHWDDIRDTFPDDKNGSRIIVTTRTKEVAGYSTTREDPFKLRFLNDEESFELFTKKVFRRQFCPDNLKDPGKKLVEKCGGLPLAIVVLGGLLQGRDKNEHTWNSMVGGVNWQLSKDQLCPQILGLSYKDLPPYLRPCFLFFGLFPEDYKISARQLFRLWISEGFIEKKIDSKGFRMEDVAEEYLSQLIARSLVQVEERRSDGGVKTCRCHDLIRDLCLELSREVKFLDSHDSLPAASSQTRPRRLSIRCNRRDYISNADASVISHVRSLFCFDQDKGKFSEDHWKRLFKRFKLLRILDLGEGEVHRIPKEIERLILLKYLRIKTTDVAGVPSTICALENLQTLDLRRSRINELPEQLWNMKQLRHLFLDGPSRLPKKETTESLSTLQTLCYISQDLHRRVKIAEKAPNLRKLGLYAYRSEKGEEESTFNLPSLESLKFSGDCIFDVQIQLPKSITKITIKGAFLEYGAMEMFQGLPNLRILKLVGETSFDDDELVFGDEWFQGLQFLKIEDSSMVDMKIGQGAMPKIERVVISKCPGLNKIPELWEELPSLKKLELLWLPVKVTKSIADRVIDIKKKNDVEVVVYRGSA